MYNLLEYSDNYSMTSWSFWNYYRGEINDDKNESNYDNNNNNNNKKKNRINNNEIIRSKFVKYKTDIIGSTPNNNNILDAEVVFSLKYLSNFWRSLDSSFINCKMELE